MRPRPKARAQSSRGNVASSSRRPATGMISLRAKARAVSRRCCCSSVRSNPIMLVPLRLRSGRRHADAANLLAPPVLFPLLLVHEAEVEVRRQLVDRLRSLAPAQAEELLD